MELSELFDMQEELMRIVENKDNTENTAKDNIVALIVEASEFLNEEGSFKWWKHNHTQNRDKMLEEYVDIFFFFMQAGIKAGFSPTEIQTEYLRKWRVNANRQRDNY